MDSQSQITIQSKETFAGLALYLHLHPTYFGLVVYDHRSGKMDDIDIDIHHPEGPSTSAELRDHIDTKRLQAWLKNNSDRLNQAYDKVRVCVSTGYFQVINDEAQASDELFAIMNNFEDGALVIRTDRIRDDLFVQFGLDKNLNKLLASHFESHCVHFGERGFLQLLSAESDLFADGMYCQLLGHEATIAIVAGSRLVFFNKYPVKNREDLLYYILLCLQSHDLDPNDARLFLSGLVESASPMYELVYDYVRNVEFMELPGEIHWPEGREQEFSSHYFINLLSIR